jgi:hypothetical protein
MAVICGASGRIRGAGVEEFGKMFHVKRPLVQENETRIVLIVCETHRGFHTSLGRGNRCTLVFFELGLCGGLRGCQILLDVYAGDLFSGYWRLSGGDCG